MSVVRIAVDVADDPRPRPPPAEDLEDEAFELTVRDVTVRRDEPHVVRANLAERRAAPAWRGAGPLRVPLRERPQPRPPLLRSVALVGVPLPARPLSSPDARPSA